MLNVDRSANPCIRDRGWKTSANESRFRTWNLRRVGMILIDLVRVLPAKSLTALLSIHRTQGGAICGVGDIQPPVNLGCCQSWWGLIGPVVQTPRFLPNPAPWKSPSGYRSLFQPLLIYGRRFIHTKMTVYIHCTFSFH